MSGLMVNKEEIEWKPFPDGWYITDVKYHVLWENPETGATLVLIKIPKGSVWEFPHSHPRSNQMGVSLSGKTVNEDGSTVSWGENNYGFFYNPKGPVHGPRKGSKRKVIEDWVILQYFDGPPTKINEGETKEISMD